MRHTKHALFYSVISLVLCVAMLIGSTFAWFTDSVSSNDNIIQSGNLDIGLLWTEDLEARQWIDTEKSQDTAVFSYDLWEPGYTEVRHFKIQNKGSLAFKYALNIIPNGAVSELADVIDVFTLSPAQKIERQNVTGMTYVGTLADVINGKVATENHLLAGEEATLTVALKMQESAGNYYQGMSIGTTFDIQLVATQYEYEADSFGTDYDAEAAFPFPDNKLDETATATAVVEDGVVKEALVLSNDLVSATIPEGVKVSQDTLTLTVKDMTKSESNITLGENEEIRALDVHIEGVASDNDVPMTITLNKVAPVGLNLGSFALYHRGVKMVYVEPNKNFSEKDQFKYDPATGDIVLYMATFSEVAVVADTVNAWDGNFDYSWYTNAVALADGETTADYNIANADQLAAFGAIVGGMDGQTQDSFSDKTVKLIADVNIGDKDNANESLIFYPIGYWNSEGTYEKTDVEISSGFYAFEGTFDGNGHTIANFYQNTWEMKGDNNYYDAKLQYYRDGMGLFGKVYGGTVKNLTVANFSSDGEYTTTGVIAAYADSSTEKSATFENIAIVDCNPRVYNIGNGGIVGCGGWYSKDTTTSNPITFKNITVDKTNTISALWGSWDVACGGIMGQYYPNSGCGVAFENCNMAAQIDVYNDVCANYQYYAYRYAGMMIGSIRANLPADENGHVYPDMTGITASNCTVNYGDWNDYYYCEFEENTMASYSEDYQFSRVPNSEIDTTNGKENATCIGHDHTEAEDKQAVYLPFSQLFTGYGWGVTSKGLNDFDGIKIKIEEVEQNTTELKFDCAFPDTTVNEEGVVQTDFLYRVGNLNTVSIGSLFAAIDEVNYPINDAGVYVTIDKVDEDMDVSGTFTANTGDWKQGTIQFSGTGVVKVTIQDYDYCTPTVLYLEVVDAKNVTSATSATINNVVLLNDISGTFTVSNGYTFYGNGFTVTLPTTSVQDVGNGFTGYISIGASQDDGVANGGHLDNVRIEGPVYPEMYIYRDQAKITDSSDADYGDGYNMRYFKNSVIVYGGNCTISNCYISGSRTALCLRGGNNVVVENTTLSGGAYANMQICAGSSVTLRDLTTVQVDVSDSYGKGKTAHGLGIAVDSSVVDIYIEGELNQYNWLCAEQWNSIVPSNYQSAFPKFFTDTSFREYWHYLNSGEDPYVNMAFIYACNWDTSKIHDNRTTVDYNACDATIAGVSGGVYSKVNTVGGNAITDSYLSDPGYTSPGFNPVAPVLSFDNTANNDEDDANDANDTYCVYDETSGTLKIGVSGDSKTLDLSGVTITKNGVELTHTAYLNGTQISENSVTIKAADGAKQTLTFKATSNDAGYDKDGAPIEGSIEYTWNVIVEMAVLAYPAPVWNMKDVYTFDTSNCVYAYYATSQGYGEAVPIYEGIKVNYYNKSGTLVELDLSGTTTLPTGSENSNANAFTYTLSDGSTLTMKFSSGWKSGATTHQFTTYNNKVYIYPQSLDNDNYVRAKTTNQDFNVKITYTFTDPNGQSTETVTMNWYNAAASNGSVNTVQWKTFDSTNGKECITPDTLITLADGSQVRVDSLTGNEELLVWNMSTGKLDSAPIMFVDSEAEAEFEIIHLYFSDGTDVKVISEHGFWDYDLNKYVYLDRYAEDYIGHTFAKQNGDSLEKVQLVDVVLEREVTTAWSPVTVDHLCYFVNGMLSMPGGVGGLLNIFEVDPATMTYDYESMAKDIETYGLFTYEELNAIVPLSEKMFNAAGGAFLKVSIGKGNLTMDELIYMIQRYSPFFN